MIMPASVTRLASLIVSETSCGRRRADEDERRENDALPPLPLLGSADFLALSVAAIFAIPTSVSPAAAQTSSSRSRGGAARAAATSSAGVEGRDRGQDEGGEGDAAAAADDDDDQGSAFSSAERGRVEAPSSPSRASSSSAAAAFSAATRTASAAEKTTESTTDSGTAGRADATEVRRTRRLVGALALASASALAPPTLEEEGEAKLATSAAVGGLALRRSSDRSAGKVSSASATRGCRGERCVQRSVVAWAHELFFGWDEEVEEKKKGQRGGVL